MAVQKPNGHEADDEFLEGGQHRTQPPAELSRRGFLGALLGATATAALGACNDKDITGVVSIDDIDDEEENLSPERKIALNNDIGQIRRMIVDKYPTLGDVNEAGELVRLKFRKLAVVDEENNYESDPLVQAYFLKASYNDLCDDDLIRNGDDIIAWDYLHPDLEMWPQKISLMRNGIKNKKGKWVLKPNPDRVPDVEQARENVRPYGVDLVDYKLFDEITNNAAERVLSNLPENENNLELNDFTTIIDADLLMAIAIHEIIPKKMDGKKMNSTARVALLRALFEKGFEINKIPAIGDTAMSFGAVQMTNVPYEGKTPAKQGDFEEHMDRFNLPHRLYDCVKLEDQMVAAMLLQFVNFNRLFKKHLLENEVFMGLWEKASLIERRTFMSTILAAAHNNQAYALKALTQAIDWKRTKVKNASALYWVDGDPKTMDGISNLMDLREGFINILGTVHGIASDHARQSSDLVDYFSRYNMDSHPVSPERIAEAEKVTTPVETGGPVIEEPISPESPKPTPKPLLETREIKMTPKGPDGNKHYVYTVPNWKLSKLLEILCGSSDAALRERIKKHNKNTDKFDPGDVIWIPLNELKPELKEQKLVEFKIPKSMGSSKEAFVRSILKEGYDPDIALLYLPTKEALSDLNDLDGIVRLPKSIVKEND